MTMNNSELVEILRSVAPDPRPLVRGMTADVLVTGCNRVSAAPMFPTPEYLPNYGLGQVGPAVVGRDLGMQWLPWNGKPVDTREPLRDVLVLTEEGRQVALTGVPVRTTSDPEPWPSIGEMVMVVEGEYKFSILRVIGADASGVTLRRPGVFDPNLQVSKWVPVRSGSVVTVRRNVEESQVSVPEPVEDAVTEYDEKVMTPEAKDLADAVEAQALRANKAEQALDLLWEALEAKATELGWCSDYDNFAEENGGPLRPATWQVNVEMTTEVSNIRLDKVLGDALNTSNRRIDVQDNVEILHRTDFEMEGQFGPDGPEASEVEKELLEGGWIFDSFDIISTYKD